MAHISPTAEWERVLQNTKAQASEAFAADDAVLNLIEGGWSNPGSGRHYESAIDGRSLGRIPMLDLETARSAVAFAKSEAAGWAWSISTNADGAFPSVLTACASIAG